MYNGGQTILNKVMKTTALFYTLSTYRYSQKKNIAFGKSNQYVAATAYICRYNMLQKYCPLKIWWKIGMTNRVT